MSILKIKRGLNTWNKILAKVNPCKAHFIYGYSLWLAVPGTLKHNSKAKVRSSTLMSRITSCAGHRRDVYNCFKSWCMRLVHKEEAAVCGAIGKWEQVPVACPAVQEAVPWGETSPWEAPRRRHRSKLCEWAWSIENTLDIHLMGQSMEIPQKTKPRRPSVPVQQWGSWAFIWRKQKH